MDLDPLQVQQALQGDRLAFQGLVEKTWGLVYVFIHQRLSDEERARDLTQDTFMQAYDKRSTLRDNGSFISWLLTIARRKVIDNHRRRGSHPETPLTAATSADLRDPGEAPTRGVETEEAQRQIQHALAQLDDRYRAVLTLRYWSGLTPAQIARLLAEPEGTIRNRIFRAHERLRKILEKSTQPAPAAGRPISEPPISEPPISASSTRRGDIESTEAGLEDSGYTERETTEAKLRANSDSKGGLEEDS